MRVARAPKNAKSFCPLSWDADMTRRPSLTECTSGGKPKPPMMAASPIISPRDWTDDRADVEPLEVPVPVEDSRHLLFNGHLLVKYRKID